MTMKKRTGLALGETHMSVGNVTATPNAQSALLDYHHAAGVDRIGNA